MADISTAQNAIDRKLHAVVLKSDPERLHTAIALAKSIEEDQVRAFQYEDNDGPKYVKASGIVRHVYFAREIGLLDGSLGITRPKSDIRALENFQSWLGDKVLSYLDSYGASLTEMSSATEVLFSSHPSRLPTLANMHQQLNTQMKIANMSVSLKILALLRPGAIRLLTRRLIVIPGTLEE